VPRDYTIKLPKKILAGALRSALAAKFQDNKMTVVDHLSLEAPKTKSFVTVLGKLSIGPGTLVVNDMRDRNLELSSRNIAGCDLVRHHDVHAYHILSHDQLLITEGALTRLQEALR
jgi:large subunit ribosomal protein L4